MTSLTIEAQSSLSASQSADLWQGHPLLPLVSIPYPAPREFWVIRERSSRKILARIGAARSVHHPERGFVGFFELNHALSPNEALATTRQLLDQACEFLARNGARVAIGPIHYNTWLPYRFQLTAQDTLCYSWEPGTPPHWAELWQNCGFSVEMTYYSEGYSELERFAERLKPYYDRATSAGFRFEPIDQERLLDREISRLYDLSMRGFADAHLFEPIPEQLFRELYIPLADKNASGQLRHSCLIFAPERLHPDPDPIGFSFNFVQGDSLILKTIAVLPKFRGMGLSNAGMYPGVERARLEGVKKWVTALVKTGAQSESYGQGFKPEWRHEYALYQRKLSNF